MIVRSLLVGAIMMSVSGLSYAQPVFPIWPHGDAPGASSSTAQPQMVERSKDAALPDRAAMGIRSPEITVYQAEKPNGMALLITPGGSYQRVVLDKEGSDLAPFFNQQGYTLFVMTYRMPGEGHKEGADAPLADAQRAIRTLRANAEKWHINPQRIGIMGFSAGGHVAASLGTRFSQSVYPAMDAIDSVSARPDFMVLMYPVISMQADIAHAGSRKQLIGEQPTEAQVTRYSPEKQVTAQTPPTFLVHAVDDPSVSVDNSLVMFNALRGEKIPVEMHLFEKGKHGFGLRGTKGLPAATWPQLLDNWLQALPVEQPKAAQ
ncbi:pectin acetylesterase PaeX [Pectobacterium parmentieri]|uniref:Alpha/beta hydrolase n=1 Tax=Pectobacterium parmentieri TaxID=1905730 RepID=A0A8B3F954_PECPM|nr:pectin acetylesterase PaeX [Pectobacterium parmentieri]ACX87965.1 pectin acetylesterase [Pectobacterium parmentieri WPP163]AYH05686.1 alpha/beta hydrolase [Pectobacterium parmentieri]AYH14507.1 alpha/beta hydrolase [Pectobacterium parmentieri]AYH19065.1 alpha/beta hydrolase [Pectobacterium parmentieri]AYH23209.1 alpha/beta hydrolase [Pectobacterium parmentieri]